MYLLDFFFFFFFNIEKTKYSRLECCFCIIAECYMSGHLSNLSLSPNFICFDSKIDDPFVGVFFFFLHLAVSCPILPQLLSTKGGNGFSYNEHSSFLFFPFFPGTEKSPTAVYGLCTFYAVSFDMPMVFK